MELDWTWCYCWRWRSTGGSVVAGDGARRRRLPEEVRERRERVDNNMVRKRRTDLPGTREMSETQEQTGSGGRGPQHPPERAPVHHQQGRGGGRGSGPFQPQQSQYGGRGGGYYHGRGGGPQHRGGMSTQYHGAPTSEYQGHGGPQHPEYQGHGGPPYPQYQGRGGPQPRGGMPQQQFYGGQRGNVGLASLLLARRGRRHPSCTKL
ncbi:uncharacterized protein A4U43_UnF6590 [Asparagus officinalis]|uniref:Uncharacterized protein n=1 Tax=Asparagus officinalis TaxID=4686 RepID=A0A1R3L6E6_ASPOF|nr:uncharacterized protein A4U43_UnF6590 [Asparagus officinalis]